MLWQTSRNEIRGRYAGSLLGLLWVAVYPLLFLGVYGVIFTKIFPPSPERFPEPLHYVLLIFCGLVPFLGFAEALSLGVASVTSNAQLIKNTLFPIELIPVKAVAVSQFTQVVGTALLLTALALTRGLTPWALLLPLVWFLQVIFSVGLMWVLSGLNVFLRDIQQVVGIAILVLMIFSPIAYTAEMVPPGLRVIIGLNPLFYFITAMQDCLWMQRSPPWQTWAVMAGLAAVFFWAGYGMFARLKPVFADHV
jgi:lipopolysaccharide transport system permease protein